MSQDPTFDLINSLTANEKRFFRLQSGKDKNYLRVFDAIDNMEEYDHALLKKKLKNKNLNISYEKNYLGKQILKVLRNIGSLDSPLLNTNSLLADVEILYSKRLFSQALNKIEEAKELSWKFDYFGMYMELLSVQKRILILSPSKGFEKIFVQLEKEQTEGLKMLNNLFEFVKVNSKLHVMAVSKGALIGKKDLGEIGKLVTEGVMSDIKNALSPTAKMLFYSIRMGERFFAGDLKTALSYNQSCIEIFEKYPVLFEKNPQNYIALVSNNTILKLNDGQFVEARTILNKLKEIDKMFDFKPSPAVRSDIFGNCMKLEIAIATESGTIDFRAGMAKSLTAEFENYKKGISEYDRIVITYYLGIINYFDKNVQAALRILNDIVNEQSREIANDYYLFSKLLLALIHFEKENFDLARKLLKNTEQSNELAKLIGEFIRNRNHETHSKKEKQTMYKDFHAHASEWLKKNKLLVFFPLLRWIEEKL